MILEVSDKRTIQDGLFWLVQAAYAARLGMAGLCDRGPNVKSVVMSLAGIITEIDSYLARLRRARELLLPPTMEGRRDFTPLPKSKVKLKKPLLDVRSRTRVEENKPRPQRRFALGEVGEECADSASVALRSVRSEIGAPEQAGIAATTLVPQRVGEAEALSSTEPKLPIVARGRSTSPRKFRIKEHKIKPATALASPMTPRIVVVSAEQAKQERDRATHAEIRPPRVPAGGLSGKRAFEALFRD